MTVDFNYMYDGKEYNAVANFIEGSSIQETHYSILLNRDELPILKERYFIDPFFLRTAFFIKKIDGTFHYGGGASLNQTEFVQALGAGLVNKLTNENQ